MTSLVLSSIVIGVITGLIVSLFFMYSDSVRMSIFSLYGSRIGPGLVTGTLFFTLSFIVQMLRAEHGSSDVSPILATAQAQATREATLGATVSAQVTQLAKIGATATVGIEVGAIAVVDAHSTAASDTIAAPSDGQPIAAQTATAFASAAPGGSRIRPRPVASAKSATVLLFESGTSGVNGAATLTANGEQTDVMIVVTGGNRPLSASITTDRCDEHRPSRVVTDKPIEIDTGNVGVTAIDVALSDLLSGQYRISLDFEGMLVACGDIVPA